MSGGTSPFTHTAPVGGPPTEYLPFSQDGNVAFGGAPPSGLSNDLPSSGSYGDPITRLHQINQQATDFQRSFSKQTAAASNAANIAFQAQNTARATQAQAQITGRAANQSYVPNRTKFDGSNGRELLEAKGPGYARGVSDGEFVPLYCGANSLLDQAFAQISAANGTPIIWHVAEPETADAIRNIFLRENITQLLSSIHYYPTIYCRQHE